MIEREIDYRGSKSELVNNSVKEQRVDGSWSIKAKFSNMLLRYTLMGFERNYRVRIPSNQIIKGFYTSQTILEKTILLNPWFISGFTDAEGCFTLSIVKDHRSKTGNISKHGSMLQFRVESIKDLAKVINHFDSYPLITKKYADYILFKKAYNIFLNKEHLNKEGLEKFVGFKASMNKGLSDSLKLAFPNVAVIKKSKVIDSKIPDPQWLAGFATGEGVNVQLKFQLTQHTRDESLIRRNVFKNQDTYVFDVSKISDLNSKIIPFFKEYPILGSKIQVIELMNNKVHLTKEGLDLIFKIKEGMNRGRK
ncbi:homing endonuclease [Rhizopogon vinicolor AM-OR11-026]|uniref:Homing endonuclease n=1 Tax=Rhizopogon vinicolor AM-OR11-026 TaxID=1314800 RepID=A0A1B7MFY3_9AGAM|nr:homing endonuclease [Rhizopogon vinicolor AM-OR11-026]